MSVNPHYSDHEEALPSYLGRLTQSPLLTSAEEIQLTRAFQAGDQKARCKLVESNMRLVINIAKSYRNRSIPLEDLIQEGAIGLMQAAERFDPDRGFRFSTYATHWVRQAIGRAIDNKSKTIRLPAHISQALRRIDRERAKLLKDLGCDPTADELARAMGMNISKLKALLVCSQELLSLDMNVGDTAGVTLGGLIRDRENSSPEEQMLSRETIIELKKIILELNEREQRVIRLRFRMDGVESSFQDEIAQEMQLSRERVRQIESQAIKKLRLVAQKRRLSEIIDR